MLRQIQNVAMGNAPGDLDESDDFEWGLTDEVLDKLTVEQTKRLFEKVQEWNEALSFDDDEREWRAATGREANKQRPSMRSVQLHRRRVLRALEKLADAVEGIPDPHELAIDIETLDPLPPQPIRQRLGTAVAEAKRSIKDMLPPPSKIRRRGRPPAGALKEARRDLIGFFLACGKSAREARVRTALIENGVWNGKVRIINVGPPNAKGNVPSYKRDVPAYRLQEKRAKRGEHKSPKPSS
jgi:hypothetical protein